MRRLGLLKRSLPIGAQITCQVIITSGTESMLAGGNTGDQIGGAGAGRGKAYANLAEARA
jgi:hypothetical protein